MPTAPTSVATQVIEELRRDPALRDQFAQVLGDSVATKADIARVLDQLVEQGRILERHTQVLEAHGQAIQQLTEAVREQGKRIEEQGQRIEEQGKRIEEQGKRIEEQGKRIEEQGKHIETQGQRIEEQGRRIEEQGKHIENQGKRVEEAFRRVEAMGARWGLHAESAFREGMQSVLARRFGAEVQHWEGFDPDGIVFGHPASIELDLVVRNGGTLLIELKSHVSRGDLVVFHRKAKIYEQVTGTHAERLVVSPSVEPRARELARDLGIEISTSLAD
jgi:hypothetical protein